jgi:hypothetical protein
VGFGGGGLGFGVWWWGPNPQSPIPNPQSPIPNPHLNSVKRFKINKLINYINKLFKINKMSKIPNYKIIMLGESKTQFINIS